MKKVSVILLVFFYQSLIAQPTFNITIGTTISSFSEDLMPEFGFDAFRDAYIGIGGSATSDVTNTVRAGFYLAAEVDYLLSEKLFIKSGLKYTTLGDSYFFKTDDVVLQSGYGGESDGKYIFKPRIDYIAIPINIGIKAHENVRLYVGVDTHLAVNNILRTSFYEAGKNDNVKQKWDKIKDIYEVAPLVPFFSLGMSYQYMDATGATVLFDLRFKNSLTSIYDDPAIDNSLTPLNNTKMWGIELGMGIVLN